MKTFFIFIMLLSVCTNTYSQSYQKYNKFLNRTEFYDSDGNMTGYTQSAMTFLTVLNIMTATET